MPYERTGYAPWSLTREAGVESATVDGTIQVPQYVYPNLDTGFIDEKGVWQGRKSNDRSFIGMTTALAIGNTGEALFPDTNDIPSIDMTGYSGLFIAIKPSNGGNYAITAVMGPDTQPFANLTPVNAAASLRGNNSNDLSSPTLTDILVDGSDALTADVWNIYIIGSRLKEQKNMQFKITNNSGGASDIEFGFMRLV
jgi:hypothetical protein